MRLLTKWHGCDYPIVIYDLVGQQQRSWGRDLGNVSHTRSLSLILYYHLYDYHLFFNLLSLLYTIWLLIQSLHSPKINLTVLSTVSASKTLFRALRYFVFLLNYPLSLFHCSLPFIFALFLSLFVFLFRSSSLSVFSVSLSLSLSLSLCPMNTLFPILIDLLQAKVMIMRIIIMMMMISTTMIAFLIFIARHNFRGDATIGLFFIFHCHVFRQFFFLKFVNHLAIFAIATNSKSYSENVIYFATN